MGKKTSKPRFVEIDGEQVPVSQSTYSAYKRPAWAEKKRREREKLCRDDNGRRCKGDCRFCPKTRDGAPLSYERLVNGGHDVPVADSDPAIIHEDYELRRALHKAMSLLSEDERILIDALFYSNGGKGMTEREYAAQTGIPQKTINDRKARIVAKLKKLLRN